GRGGVPAHAGRLRHGPGEGAEQGPAAPGDGQAVHHPILPTGQALTEVDTPKATTSQEKAHATVDSSGLSRLRIGILDLHSRGAARRRVGLAIPKKRHRDNGPLPVSSVQHDLSGFLKQSHSWLCRRAKRVYSEQPPGEAIRLIPTRKAYARSLACFLKVS